MKKEAKTKNAIMNEILLQKNILNNKKSEAGITLIALVITIIVLLILAGVAIATLTGDNRNTNTITKGKIRKHI